MATILVKIDTIRGEAELDGYAEQIECNAVRHAVDLPVVAQGATRTEGASRHGTLDLSHNIDAATPLLKFSASSGTNLGTVVVTKLKMAGGRMQASEVVTLQNVYVTRIDTDTPVDPQSGRPADDAVETFSLEYSDITWRHVYLVDGEERGSVETGWSVARQSTI